MLLALLLAVLRQACNELTGPISRSLRPGNTAPFKEMLQQLKKRTLLRIFEKKAFYCKGNVDVRIARAVNRICSICFTFLGNVSSPAYWRPPRIQLIETNVAVII